MLLPKETENRTAVPGCKGKTVPGHHLRQVPKSTGTLRQTCTHLSVCVCDPANMELNVPFP